MKHARPDYDRFQDPEGKIPADEPVFLLRGQDALAWGIVRAYADEAAKARRFDIAMASYQQAEAMRKWCEQHGKLPDMA